MSPSLGNDAAHATRLERVGDGAVVASGSSTRTPSAPSFSGSCSAKLPEGSALWIQADARAHLLTSKLPATNDDVDREEDDIM